MFKAGEIVLAKIQFADTPGVKQRPALVLFEELGNAVVAGITSNPNMKGVPLTRAEGAIKESVIKLNYIFTISEEAVVKRLFTLSQECEKRLKNCQFQRSRATHSFAEKTYKRRLHSGCGCSCT